MSLESEKPDHEEEAKEGSNESSLQTSPISAESEESSQKEERTEAIESSNSTRVEFKSAPQNEQIRTPKDDSDPVQGIQPSRTSMTMAAPGLAGLHTPHKKRRLILVIGVVLATLDLCCLPIT